MAVAHADSGVSVGATMGAQMDTQGENANASTSMMVEMGAGGSASGEGRAQEGRGSDHATSTERALMEIRQHAAERAMEHANSPLFLGLESTTTEAFSLAELKQMIDTRKQELDQEEASTTAADRGIVKNANDVRLAVHALLAAKPLLGGIGQEVSQIAQQVDASVATTTDAEAQIEARGFWTRLFFGGDSAAAAAIKDEVTQNQQRIQTLMQLLNQANVSADVKATLSAQIAAMETQQVNLESLAQKEQGQWGLFSWRF